MELKILDTMTDARLRSQSILVSVEVADYLTLIAEPYDRQGGLEGQRGALSTTTALRIRERMVDDLGRGAILPPLVLGITASPEVVTAAASWSESDLCSYIENTERSNIAIIDGMQRTTALELNRERMAGRRIRVELWIVPQSSALTYRMLVLNTGQVPWNLRRQLEVLNLVLLAEIRRSVDVKRCANAMLPVVEVFGIDDKRRRAKAGQYQAHEVIELYLAFGMRKHSVDKESALADQFSRLDMVEAVSNETFFSDFVEVLLAMAQFDVALERLDSASAVGRFRSGRAIFDSQPACVAWAVAAAQIAYGRPGTERSRSVSEPAIKRIAQRAADLAERMGRMDPAELSRFADLATLNEVLGQQTGKIGDFERAFFLDAFRVLLSEPEVPASMTSCWRAH